MRGSYLAGVAAFALCSIIAGASSSLASDGVAHFADAAVATPYGTPSQYLSVLNFKIGMKLEEAKALLPSGAIKENRGTGYYLFEKSEKKWHMPTDEYTNKIKSTFDNSETGIREEFTLYFTSPLTGNRLYAVEEQKFMPDERRPPFTTVADSIQKKWGRYSFRMPAQIYLNEFIWYIDTSGNLIPGNTKCYMKDDFGSLRDWDVDDVYKRAMQNDREGCGAIISAGVMANDTNKPDAALKADRIDVFMYDNRLRLEGIDLDRRLLLKSIDQFNPSVPKPVNPNF